MLQHIEAVSSHCCAKLCWLLASMYAQTRGGGNCANALTAAARLGLEPHLVSKVGADSIGEEIEQELLSDGVQTSFLLKATDHPSPFTYIIVDKQGGSLLLALSKCFSMPATDAQSCRRRLLQIKSLLSHSLQVVQVTLLRINFVRRPCCATQVAQGPAFILLEQAMHQKTLTKAPQTASSPMLSLCTLTDA